MSNSRRILPLATCAAAITAFYLHNLNGVGMMSTDEPRYAAIGQAMAQSGDWLTPKLWGAAWFEKPPLLYWMAAGFFKMGLAPETAARLPVALLSLAFLALAWRLLEREFGETAATAAVGWLATSAGWIAYSNFCLTDLPLAVCFSLAVLLALPLLRGEPEMRRIGARFLAIGVALGLAALAKGLVPFVLALPLGWFLRRWWRWWSAAAAGCVFVAGPWYAAMYGRHGMAFVNEFLLKHHFARLYSSSLQHVQPWYYYAPVLLAALFPWTPMAGLLAWKRGGAAPWDKRRQLLLATVMFGFVFFSISLNKLPGYLLPLLPALFALAAAQLEGLRVAELNWKWWLGPAALIALIPLVAKGLPGALAAGKASGFRLEHLGPTEFFYVAAPLAAVVWGRRSWLAALLILCVAADGLLVKGTIYRALDEQVSARGLWREVRKKGLTVCDAGINRDWAYGLSFYRGSELPACGSGAGQTFDRELRAKGKARPSLE